MTVPKLDFTERPLVSIGIPTYNRSALLKRAIESALNQDYRNIEVIVSDNASSDDTESICRSYSKIDGRFKYIRQSSNLGPVANFAEVVNNASGQFFMWLGDDDWIDLPYVSTCVQQLVADPTMALISGSPQYYRNGQKTHEGAVFNLLQNKWWQRVIAFYKKVSDNGMFYGVMYTAHIRNIILPATMGGDWLVLANIVSFGKAKVLSEISVHRELGGATASYQNIARTLGLPEIHATFPMVSIATSALLDIASKGVAFKSRPILVRFMVGVIVFIVILSKYKIGFLVTSAKTCFKRLLCANV